MVSTGTGHAVPWDTNTLLYRAAYRMHSFYNTEGQLLVYHEGLKTCAFVDVEEETV